VRQRAVRSSVPIDTRGPFRFLRIARSGFRRVDSDPKGLHVMKLLGHRGMRLSAGSRPLRQASIFGRMRRPEHRHRRRLPGPSRLYALVGSLLLALGTASSPAESQDLPFHYDLHTFRGDSSGTTIVAAVAVSASELRRERRANGTRYRFDVRFVLADRARRSVVETIDSVFLRVPFALARRHILHTVVEIRDAPPSRTTEQRIVVTDAARPGVGQMYLTPFPTPDYSGSELMLSDLAFAMPNSRSGWTRRGVTLALLPTSQFPESAFDIYYEVYNLPRGHPYETEIAIEPTGDDADDEQIVRARFSEQSGADPDGTLGVLRRIESALPEGRYRITVTVRDQVGNRTAHRSRIVDVVGWRPGTTIVRARPKRGGG
jgi:hypothetical protein